MRTRGAIGSFPGSGVEEDADDARVSLRACVVGRKILETLRWKNFVSNPILFDRFHPRQRHLKIVLLYFRIVRPSHRFFFFIFVY